MEQERQKRKEEKEEGARNKLESLQERKQLVTEKKANSASTWGNKKWLSENTCSVCRQQHSSAKTGWLQTVKRSGCARDACLLHDI